VREEPFYAVPGKQPVECVSALEAMRVANIQSNQRIFVHGAAMTPDPLLNGLGEYASERDLSNVGLVHIHLMGKAMDNIHGKYSKHFRDNSLFIGANCRKAVNSGDADFTPMFLSEIPRLFEGDEDFPTHHALISVSPPDEHGYCSLGTSIDCARSALIAAKHVIGLINTNVPRTHGDSAIHISHFDAIYHENIPLWTHEMPQIDDVTSNIGKHIAELIPDRACLQMGIGGIPDAVLLQLTGHKGLGIHTEMFSDGVLNLMDLGVMTHQHKFHHPGKLVTSFAMGTKRLYDFVNDNPGVNFCDCSYVNDPGVISQNRDTHAINACIEVDLTGQVCADSIGTKMYSGIGGQMDFMRGAMLSVGGKAIMSLESQTKKGVSKIVPTLKDGAGVVTTRAHVQYFATEYGVVKLFGKSLRERAKLLIGLAHPDHREALDKAAFERFGRLNLNASEGEKKVDGDW